MIRYLIMLAVPLAVLGIALSKTAHIWLPVYRSWPQWQRVVAVVALSVVVAYGGSKPQPPGPTKANLRLLLAERVRLSNGMEYGRKADAVSAQSAADAAAAALDAAALDVAASSNLIASSSHAVQTATGEPRKYMRLGTPPPAITNNTLYGEIADVRVDAGVAVAAVWFNVIPSSAPGMRFSFASRAATNRWHTATAEQSSWPTTYGMYGRDCYLFYFPCPPELLDADGDLIAPLHYAQEIGWGSPDTGEPLNLLGGLAVEVDGQYWEAVTGIRTNAAGEQLYFEAGRLAVPAKLAEEDPIAY